MQYIKILPECVILFFFLEQIITLHRGSRGIQNGNNPWRRLGLINSGITFLVIVSEIMVGLITIGQRDYRELPDSNGDYGSILETLELFLTCTYTFRYLNVFSACHVFHGECVSGKLWSYSLSRIQRQHS